MSLQRRSVVMAAFVAVAVIACGGGRQSNFEPIAHISVDPAAGPTPLVVTLRGSLSIDPMGQIVSYDWDFGDGTAPASGKVTSHIYERPGAFTAKLTVTDDQGATASASQRVDVANRPPAASFAPYIDRGYVAAVMRFDATASVDPDGSILRYHWDFGDGASGEGAVADHRYLALGEHVVQLTVHDDFGAIGSMKFAVQVLRAEEFPVYQMQDLGTFGGLRSAGLSINDSGQVVGSAQTADGRRRAFLFISGQPMVDLGTLGGLASEASAVNDAGQVTGSAQTPGGTYHAFLAAAGQPMVDLGALAQGKDSHGSAINEAGQVTGWAQIAGDPWSPTHAILARAGEPMVDLGILAGGRESRAHAINDAGVVTGQATTDRGVLYEHAFVAKAGPPIVDLGTLGGPFSWGRAINDAGQITGYAYRSDGKKRAFVVSAGQSMVDLGTLGGNFSEGTAINSSGQVTGGSEIAAGPMPIQATHAFVARQGQSMEDLGTLGGSGSWGYAINDAGQVTGQSQTAEGHEHAFVVQAGQPMVDLGTLGGPSSWGWAINNAGQVTGWSMSADSPEHAFLASPIVLLFERLIEWTAGLPAASGLVPALESAQAGYENKDPPTSCEALSEYDAAVTDLAPGQISQLDADKLLDQSAAIARELDCP